MSEFDPIPQSISYKKLNSMLISACKESNRLQNEPSIEKEEFKKLIHNWTESSQEIMNYLNSHKEILGKGKEAKSLMALGAMEVHLSMAFQALKASKIEE